MTLRYKFVLPINLILVLILVASLAWEWRRQEATGLALLRARLDEEARFVEAAYRSFGTSGRFGPFLHAFCHASDASASPEHQVAVVDAGGRVVASAAEHARRPMDPARLAGLGDGFWTRRIGDDSFLIRVAAAGPRRVVVAESTRAVRDHVRANLRSQVGWFLGAGVLLLGAVNVVMRHAVLRPIRRISRAVRALERGRLGVEVASPNGDELGALARQFNAMSRALAERAEAERREMEVARLVQAHLLPPPELELGRVRVAGRCVPAGPVGGDLYDVRPLSGDRVALLVADLSGHNVAAALHTAMVRAIVWREADEAPGPGEVLARLNGRLCRELPEEHFATAFFGWFEARSGRLRYASAGHPAALLLGPSGTVSELGPTMPLLGIMPDLAASEADVELDPAGRLLVFTDGLIEVSDPAGKLWGADELPAILASGAGAGPAQLVERLIGRRAEVRADGSPHDDVTVVVADYASSAVGPNAAAGAGAGSVPR
ncbi:PP2C family protein-serine/threonine phosphatase [Tautonia sociabilis]|uniref:HAMP domain-containing protein n=1 Tax=Tautonia sociabilis TaxID=2080755 RepID=A0A432MI43_9BACT|nr:SpoIIE family protein phosphatase [Tautonia sociabilis]RUL87044.1 HAMP domain-containing protein [Tautonia sociabilis]